MFARNGCWALLVGVLGALGWVAWQDAQPVAPAPLFRTWAPLAAEPHRIALVPVGPLPRPVVEQVAMRLSRATGASVRVLPAVAVPPEAVDASRGQAHAALLLNALYFRKRPEVEVLLGLTAADLYADGWQYLYGYSQPDGGVAIASVARPWGEMRAFAPWRASAAVAHKVLVHELGHLLGLHHCRQARCAMNTVDHAAELDTLAPRYCPRCALQAQREVRSRERDPLARADGLYRRGAFVQAWAHYAVLALQEPFAASRINRLGVASAALGAGAVAEKAYRYAIVLDDAYPLPYYNLGLLLAARANAAAGAPGAERERQESIAALRAGFERDPERLEALGLMAVVFYEVFADEVQAARYMRRYVEAGGRHPAILFRYDRLMHPPLVSFSDHEVPIIWGHADSSLRGAIVEFKARLFWLLELRSLVAALGP